MLRLLFKLVLGACILFTPVAGYIAAPFWTAWSIREAVTGSDTAYLQRKVQWATVRETMRESMTRTALDLPVPGVAEAEVISAPRRGFLARIKQRIKNYAGRRVVDKMVASYVSAEGLPQLYNARRTMRETIGGEAGDPDDWTERFKSVWSRITRAEFRSITAFEIELRDQFSTERSYHAVLEFKGAEWILTELRIRSSNEITPVASAR